LADVADAPCGEYANETCKQFPLLDDELEDELDELDELEDEELELDDDELEELELHEHDGQG